MRWNSFVQTTAMDDNPFRADNADLDEVTIGAMEADDLVQRTLQQADNDISLTMSSDPDLIFQPSSSASFAPGLSLPKICIVFLLD